jgi:putative transcriptional regulator
VAKGKERQNRIKLVLVELEIEQQELARRLGVAANTVNQWCANNSQPSIATLRKIGIALGVNAQELIEPTPTERSGS